MAAKKTLAQRIAADPKLKQKYLKNPGLRSKLPDSALTPAQRKTRQTNAYNKAPITPGSTVTNSALDTETAAATKTAYGSEQQALDTQYAKAQGLGRDVTGWYDAYRKELQAHTANTQAMNAAAVGQIGALGAGMRGLDQTALTGQQTAANQDAATRGASAANLGPDASNASLVRQQMLAGYGVEQVGLGAAAGRMADARANVVAPTQKLQAQAQAAQGVRDVGTKITELGQRKGAYATKYKGQRVADEAKTVLANAALGVNAMNVKADAASAAANTAEAKRAHNITAQQGAASLAETVRSHQANETAAQARIRIAAEKAQNKGKKPVSGPGSLTPIKEQERLREIRKIQQRLAHPTATKPDPATGANVRVPTTLAGAITDLQNANVDPDSIAVAQSLKRNRGKLDPAGVEAAHRLGIHVGPNWKVVRKATAKGKTLAELAGGKTSTSKKPPVPGLRP